MSVLFYHWTGDFSIFNLDFRLISCHIVMFMFLSHLLQQQTWYFRERKKSLLYDKYLYLLLHCIFIYMVYNSAINFIVLWLEWPNSNNYHYTNATTSNFSKKWKWSQSTYKIKQHETNDYTQKRRKQDRYHYDPAIIPIIHPCDPISVMRWSSPPILPPTTFSTTIFLWQKIANYTPNAFSLQSSPSPPPPPSFFHGLHSSKKTKIILLCSIKVRITVAAAEKKQKSLNDHVI